MPLFPVFFGTVIALRGRRDVVSLLVGCRVALPRQLASCSLARGEGASPLPCLLLGREKNGRQEQPGAMTSEIMPGDNSNGAAMMQVLNSGKDAAAPVPKGPAGKVAGRTAPRRGSRPNSRADSRPTSRSSVHSASSKVLAHAWRAGVGGGRPAPGESQELPARRAVRAPALWHATGCPLTTHPHITTTTTLAAPCTFFYSTTGRRQVLSGAWRS